MEILPRVCLLLSGVLLAGPALAQVTAMQATGSYTLGTDPAVNLIDTLPSDPVDVLDFPFSDPDSAGLHSYGSTTGTFGSRSSGQGIYFVTGGFSITQIFTNTSAVAQNVFFNFDITPGMLQLSIVAPLTTGQFLEAGISFDVTVDSNQIYSSVATLFADEFGTDFTTSGDASLYVGAGNYYAIPGGPKSIDLGLVGSGESISLTYTLETLANGNAPASDAVVIVPGQTFFVPAQCFRGDVPNENFFDGGDGGDGEFPDEFCQDGFEVVTEPFELSGVGGSSHASSGDPFGLDSQGNPFFYIDQAPDRPAGFALVPEPATWAMLIAGFGAVGLAARRRRMLAAA